MSNTFRITTLRKIILTGGCRSAHWPLIRERGSNTPIQTVSPSCTRLTQLAVTERFIRKLIADGQLRAVKVGARVVRIRRTDLEDLLRPARIVPQIGRR